MVAGYIARFVAQKKAHTILPVGTCITFRYTITICYHVIPLLELQDLHKTCKLDS